ncbi:MAG: ABC transporter ATP-binding protein [Chloroflexota bacterium]|nr:ABC transporter ATP-binding protein [Chloroflexota bacterium]
MSILEAKALRKQYRLGEHTVKALAGVDFVVGKGEFVAIMGPSGSGKSTLLHLLGGLDKPSDGEVTLAGQRLSILDDNQATLARRHNVGFVFQFFNLLPTLTTEENVALPLIIDGQNLRKHQAHIDALLELVGLTDRRHHKPDQPSGGEQQRVAIARALVTEPAIVLADEPTGNLDSKTGTAVMGLLRRSCDELGQTVIVVTHDPRAAAYADRTVFLGDGRVIGEVACIGVDEMDKRLRIIWMLMKSGAPFLFSQCVLLLLTQILKEVFTKKPFIHCFGETQPPEVTACLYRRFFQQVEFGLGGVCCLRKYLGLGLCLGRYLLSSGFPIR